jgi:hypothetical protein
MYWDLAVSEPYCRLVCLFGRARTRRMAVSQISTDEEPAAQNPEDEEPEEATRVSDFSNPTYMPFIKVRGAKAISPARVFFSGTSGPITSLSQRLLELRGAPGKTGLASQASCVTDRPPSATRMGETTIRSPSLENPRNWKLSAGFSICSALIQGWDTTSALRAVLRWSGEGYLCDATSHKWC